MTRSTLLKSTAIIALTFCFSACSSAPPTDDDAPPAKSDQTEPKTLDADEEYEIQFRDRTIDLYPYVQGFPYSRFMPQIEHGFMLYFEDRPDGKWLQHLEFDGDDDIDVTDGRRVHDIDWSTRSFRPGLYNPELERYIFLGDEKNDEIFNVYALDLDDGELEQLTDVDYIYGYGFSDDDRLMGYVARHGSSEPFNSCLHVRDLHSDEDQVIWCDEGGDDRLTWTGVEFSPDAHSAIVRMQHDGNRNTTNLGRFMLDEPGPPQLLLERGEKHLSLWWMRDSYDGDQLLYVSSKGGINDVYRYKFETQDSERITELEHDIRGSAHLEKEGQPPLLVLFLQLPYGTIVEVRDPGDGELLWSETRDETISVVDDHGHEAILAMSSVSTPFAMERVGLHGDDAALAFENFASVPDELAEQLIQCDVERVEFATFDEVDGETRMLHAYLFEPREQPPEHLRLARITAFYGGGNFFRSAHQIMCEAGITTFSPSPRGSRGFGAEFAALNDGDLGGDDIVDLFYAARWLEVERQLRHYQIGVYGASHGGYAAMRALTFPPETNDRDDHYQFGFGLSHAGISDLLHFHQTSNIPDWLVLLAGDPETEPEKLRERSPLHHIQRLQAPLLLTHGSHDSRVPVDESRRFSEAAKEHDLPVFYEEFDGQGHGIDGLSNRLRYYRAIFEFLEKRVDPRLQDRADAH